MSLVDSVSEESGPLFNSPRAQIILFIRSFIQSQEYVEKWASERLNDLRSGKAQQKDHPAATILEISEEYKQWKLFHVDHDMI